jgi:hypothetical protein
MADRLTLETPILGFVYENVIDDASKFLRNDGASNGFIGAAEDLLVESPVFRVVLNGMDGHVSKSDLQIFVAVLAS